MKTHLPSSLALVAAATAALAGESRVETGASLHLMEAGTSLAPALFLTGWNAKGSAGGYSAEADGSYTFKIACGDKGNVNGRATFTQSGDAIDAVWTFTPDRDIGIESLYVGASFDFASYPNGVALCDDKTVPFPADEPQDPGFFRGRVSTLAFVNGSGPERLSLSFAEPASILLQDNRRWNSPNVSLRIGVADAGTLAAGTTYRCALTLRGLDAAKIVPAEKVVITAGEDWIPVVVEPAIEPGSALDFSSVVPHDAPAGKYGYAVAKGQNFEFEKLPGVSQRFYGVNFCFGANFVDREAAQRLARHLSRIGYNAVRFHHHDGGLTQGSPDGTTLNPDQIKLFDGMAAALIDEGIYLTTDLFVSRAVPFRAIGIDRDGNVPMDDMKMLVQFHPAATENYLAFARNFLGHVNPYTGRSYAEEPALSFLALVNEGNLGNHGTEAFKKYPELGDAWRTWLAARKAADPAAYGDVPDALPGNLWDSNGPGVAAFIAFLRESEERFATRVTAFLRDEMHCRALTTNMSSWFFPVAYQYPRALSYDYVDDHFYVDHPRFLESSWSLPSSCPNTNPMLGEAMGAQGLVARRILDRPFTITEYNYSGPGRFRGVGGIATGAAAALQNWAGLWRFAWSHDARGVLDPANKPMTYFDMSGDPLSLAAERASICLFLRRDLPELRHTYGFTLPQVLPVADAAKQCRVPWTWASWYAKVGGIVPLLGMELHPDAMAAGTVAEAAKRPSSEVRALLGDTPMGGGALSIDSQSGTFLLKTDRTCGGFAEGGRIEAGALTADLGDTPATLWASALDDQPIATSKRILVTHLTDVQDNGVTYAAPDRRILLKWGRIPHLMARGAAKVTLRLGAGDYTVYSLTTGGARRGEVASSYADGALSFTADIAADPASASFLYEVVRK